MNQTQRFIQSKCDRCGKATPARQNGISDLVVLPSEWLGIGDIGAFCEACVATYDEANWREWLTTTQRPDEVK